MTAQRAMMWWCGGVMLFGLVLAGGAFAATDGAAVLLLRLFGGAPVGMPAAMRFATGLMGAVTLGWGASLLAVASGTAALPAATVRPLWQRIGWAMLLWYSIDSTISVATGFWPNAVSNTVLAGLYWTIARRM